MEEIIIKKEFDHSYLLFPMIESGREEYSYQMLIQNNIPGLVNCQIRYIEDNPYYSYEISMKRSLFQEYSDKKMKFNDLKELFLNISTILNTVSEFLLEKEGFLLEPEYIFTDWENNELECVYLPVINYIEGTDNRYRKLADFLLDRTDHKDEHAVNVAYQFYKMSKEEFFSFEAFIGFMEKENLMMQAYDRRREEKKDLIVEAGNIEKTEDADIEEKEWDSKEGKQVLNLKVPGVLSIVGVLLIGLYVFIPDLKKFALYLLVPGLSMVVAAFVFFAVTLYRRYYRTDDVREMQLEESVTVEEYFDDILDNQTVFFDEETTMCLKWKEGRFSKDYLMTTFPVTVGKLKDSVQLRIDDASISRLHAQFIQQDEAVILQDLDSTNGTWVNGKKLAAGEEIIIHRNDEIQFGKIIVNVV